MMELEFKVTDVDYSEVCEKNENILIKPYMTLDELSTTYYDMMADVKGGRKDALNRHFTKIINMMKFCTNIDYTELNNEEIYDVCYANQLVNDFEYLISEYNLLDRMIERDENTYNALTSVTESVAEMMKGMNPESALKELEGVMGNVNK